MLGRLALTNFIGEAVDVVAMLAPDTQFRILCVEDEPFLRMLLVEYLTDWGYAVHEAARGREAIRLLDTLRRVDLLVTDIRLGDIDGWAVAAHARSVRPNVPVIYMSGYPTEGTSVANAVYLAKPFNYDALRASIRALLGQTLLEGRTSPG